MTFSASSGALAQASLISQVGGVAASTAGGYYSAKSQKSAAQFNAAMAELNARQSEQQAQSALQQGQRQVAAITLKAGQLKSAQRAALAANGVDLGTGSAAELQASTDIMKAADAGTAELNALQAAWGYRMQGVNSKNQALMARAQARSISPFGAAASSLLGGAGQVANSWYGLSKVGAFGGGDSSAGQWMMNQNALVQG
ncbi:hypothetical protein LH435_15090 [Laribacter hongkongensis]|uniref:hypothetical protein n=1 Tax=Laribacter hongkongensis TaxID=168471 RepID=UPI001EFCEF2A|nr:hypothetical protein [Laribacter hongkongensis]MCG9075303.1 hypothetical protein [Laribacter hongkongensis]